MSRKPRMATVRPRRAPIHGHLFEDRDESRHKDLLQTKFKQPRVDCLDTKRELTPAPPIVTRNVRTRFCVQLGIIVYQFLHDDTGPAVVLRELDLCEVS